MSRCEAEVEEAQQQMAMHQEELNRSAEWPQWGGTCSTRRKPKWPLSVRGRRTGGTFGWPQSRAAAGLSGCEILYTEDMQDGLNVKMPPVAGGATFSIKNPFRVSGTIPV